MNKKCQVFTPENYVRELLDSVGYTDHLYGKKILENKYITRKKRINNLENELKKESNLIKESNLVRDLKVEETGIRLDAYITSKLEDLSRNMVQKLIKKGDILVNNKEEKESYKVQKGDQILVVIPKPEEKGLKKQEIPLDIIYEDEDILVVNKPKGMVVHPGNGNPDGTLVNAIMAHCEDSLSGIGGEIRPGIVHRIDKDTSGLLVIAKNDKAHINLSEQIKAHKVKKTYVALVRGIVKENEATINMPIGRSNRDRKKMAVVREGKEAITHFKVIQRYDKYSLLKVNIETGRTHQIRVHLAQIGYPIIGDDTYSNGKNEWGIQGQCLHAKSLEFTHPTTGKKMYVEAEMPEYFNEILEKLEKRKIDI